MPKIKIKDLPKNAKISKAEMKNVSGGYYSLSYSASYFSPVNPIAVCGGTSGKCSGADMSTPVFSPQELVMNRFGML